MKILFKQATILDLNSPYHNNIYDVLIENGIIIQISKSIKDESAKIIDVKGLNLSTGFTDIFSNFNDPGFEQKETLISGSYAAQKGGYTTVGIIPNTNPSINNKTNIEYIKQESKNLPINILPIGAITTNTEGKNLNEIIEMHNTGALAFSDGTSPIQNAGIMLKALQYIKSFNGTIIQMPNDKSIATNGLVNESILSTQLGLQGIPEIAEEIMVARDIELCAYTNSKLHITGISTAKSLELIIIAKSKGIQVSCSVSPYHLILNEEEIINYNTNAKTINPLRNKVNNIALQNGLLNGDIDCIASHHFPQDVDAKKCEFAYAEFGMSTIEHCFNAIASIENITPIQIHNLMSSNPNKLFNVTTSIIKEGNHCNLTAFTLQNETTITANDFISKGKNSCFIGKKLKGKIIATIYNNHIYIA